MEIPRADKLQLLQAGFNEHFTSWQRVPDDTEVANILNNTLLNASNMGMGIVLTVNKDVLDNHGPNSRAITPAHAERYSTEEGDTLVFLIPSGNIAHNKKAYARSRLSLEIVPERRYVIIKNEVDKTFGIFEPSEVVSIKFE